jgi:hypothetical protein
VENLVKKKEDSFVHIYVHNYAIAENANLVNTKAPLSNAIVEKLKEWLNAVKKELFFNVVKSVKKY